MKIISFHYYRDGRTTASVKCSIQEAEGGNPNSKMPMRMKSHKSDNPAAEVLRVEFVINTYPDLQPFIVMAVLLLEGVYECKGTVIHTQK